MKSKKKAVSEDQTIEDALAGLLRSFGINKVQFAEEDGTVLGEVKAKPKKKRLAPLQGYGDTIRRGDRVQVIHHAAGKDARPLFGKPVVIVDYSPDPKDPWMVVSRNVEKPTEFLSSFHYYGGSFRNTFKKV